MASRSAAHDRSIWSFSAIGTTWEVETPGPLATASRQAVAALVESFDRTWSRFRTDSLVARIACSPTGGRWRLPRSASRLVDLYDRLAAATDGRVDPLVGRQLERLGYDAAYSLTPDAGALASPLTRSAGPRWGRDVVRASTEPDVLVTTGPVLIDVGAAGKGHLVDLVCALLVEHGVTAYVVDASGDLRHAGTTPLQVGLEHPNHPDRVVGTATLRGRALCASASNRRAWGSGLHHILDASTGMPVQEVLATWVVADDAATADGLATALFVAEPEELGAFDFEWVRMTRSTPIASSPGWIGEIFS